MCFVKRKRGLIKKAIELSKLTNAKVILTIISSDHTTSICYKSFAEDPLRFINKINC